MAKSGIEAAGREIRAHIGIYGRCNVGKSSLLNALVGAPTAIVSHHSGTTTDVVRKSYEILDFAPVVFLDTAGIDDRSALGEQRVQHALETVNQIDLALLVFESWGESEQMLVGQFAKMAVPYIPIYNCRGAATYCVEISGVMQIDAHNANDKQRNELLERIKNTLPEKAYRTPSLFGGRNLLGEVVLLVCPIDSEAPSGRLILPQVQAIRELLDVGAMSLVVQPGQLECVLESGREPVLVVADSQVFAMVRAVVPSHIELTSFSILLAAAKGDYELYEKGLEMVDVLRDGDRVLIGESCTHQVSCDDIGRVKIPRWLEKYTGCELRFTIVSGLEPLPDDLQQYKLMVQCGGCMVTRSQLRNRIAAAAAQGVAVTNYGMLIRKINSF